MVCEFVGVRYQLTIDALIFLLFRLHFLFQRVHVELVGKSCFKILQLKQLERLLIPFLLVFVSFGQFLEKLIGKSFFFPVGQKAQLLAVNLMVRDEASLIISSVLICQFSVVLGGIPLIPFCLLIESKHALSGIFPIHQGEVRRFNPTRRRMIKCSIFLFFSQRRLWQFGKRIGLNPRLQEKRVRVVLEEMEAIVVVLFRLFLLKEHLTIYLYSNIGHELVIWSSIELFTFYMKSLQELSEVVPLFDPKYQEKDFTRLQALYQYIQQQNYSVEANDLAEAILKLDPSNYNAWYIKRQHFLTLQKQSIPNELAFANSCMGQRGKTFQVWEQKRFLVEKNKDFLSQELQMVDKIIEQVDSKNYHAWSYRVWLNQRMLNYEQDLLFTATKIGEDCYNNSAWSHRYFLIEQIVQDKPEDKVKELLSSQIKFVLEKIEQAKGNKASWNYLRGFFPSIKLKDFNNQNAKKNIFLQSYNQFPAIQETCERLWTEVKEKYQLTTIPAELVELLNTEREVLLTLIHIYSHSSQKSQFIGNICDELIAKDRQRMFYWKWLKQQI